MPNGKRVALYLRVSTDGQTVDNQRQALSAEAERRGWNVIREYVDAGISGAKGRDKRPGLHACLQDVTRGRFDVLMVWAVDRLGRSLADLIGTLQELHSAHVNLLIQQQAIDTTTPFGKAMFQMLGVFAEFERSMIQARVRAGFERARKHGTKSGKPIGRAQVDDDTRETIRQALLAGHSIRLTRRLTSTGQTTIERVKREMIQAGELAAPVASSTAPDAPDSDGGLTAPG